MDIADGDIRIDFYRASGPGGQHRNTTDSAVRITHFPTGIIVTASESRSQLRNREIALERLRAALAARNRRKKPRVPTKATRAAKERRLEEKKKHAVTKKLRRTTSEE